MKTNTVEDKNYFDSFDVENAEVIKHPRIKAMQEQNSNNDVIDDEVIRLITAQDNDTKQHIYNVVREMVAMRKTDNSALSAK